MKGLQRCGASCTAVNRELDPSLGHMPCHRVQLHTLWVLDAANVPARVPPEVFHGGVVDQLHAQAVCQVPKVLQDLLEEPLGVDLASGVAAAVTGELPGRQLDVNVSPHLRLLGLCQALDVLSVPFKYGERQP